MAFVPEDGTGLSTANSYVALATATTLLQDHIDTTAWDAATDSEKQKALVSATSRIEGSYGRLFPGSRANADQALAWPRVDAEDANGQEYDSDEIPRLLELATAFRAEAIRSGAEGATSRTTGGDLDMIKVDVITLDFGDGSEQGTVQAWFDYLSPLLGGNYMVRGG